MDFNDDLVLMGHDGPGHIAIAEGKTKVRPLKVHHGKVGRGLSVEMSVKYGPGVVEIEAGQALFGPRQTVEHILGEAMASRREGPGEIDLIRHRLTSLARRRPASSQRWRA